MLAKGIIDSIDFSSNTCIVRIPQFETANSDPIVVKATFSITPGMYNGYKENDVVWVAFENNKLEHPVVIGKLFLGTEKENKDPRGTINCMISTTSQKANIPQDTVLTNEVGNDIPNTQVPYNNINELANKLNDVDVNLEYSVRDIDNRIKMKVNAVDGDENTGWGWELSPSGWSITSGGEEFFTINSEGMTVKNKGKIGQFIIGAAHTNTKTGKEESGIYSDNYIEKFEDIPDGKTGVYIGTDGIKLGSDFYITPGGEIGATKFSATFSNLLKTSTNIQDGNSNINGVYCQYTIGKDWGDYINYENQLINLVPSHLWNERTQEYLIAATEKHLYFNRENITSWIALPDFKEYLNVDDRLSDYILSFKGIITSRADLKNLQLYLGYINGTTFNTITELQLENKSLDELLTNDYTQLHYQLPSGYNLSNYDNLRIGFKWRYDSSTSTKVFGKIKEIKIEKNTMDVVNKSYTFNYSQYDLTNTKTGGIKGEISYNGRYNNDEMEVWKNSTVEITFPESSAARDAFGIAENDLFNVISITNNTTDSKVYTFTCRMSDLDDNSNIIGKILSTVVSAESASQVYLYRGTNTDSVPAYTGEEGQWVSNILEPNATNPFVWRITGIKTAEATTYIEATIAKIASATGILSILSAPTIDNKNIDLLFYDSTNNQYHLKADYISGAVGKDVKIGQGTNGNYFTIKTNDSEQGENPSAIFSPSNFNSVDSTGTGIYLGTDGINVGGKFKVTSNGTITATGLQITASQVNGFTAVTENTISTTTVVAQNLHVKAANIDDSITAKKIIIKDTNNQTILNADADDPEHTKLGGFIATKDYLSTGPTSLTDTTNEGLYLNNGGIVFNKSTDSVHAALTTSTVGAPQLLLDWSVGTTYLNPLSLNTTIHRRYSATISGTSYNGTFDDICEFKPINNSASSSNNGYIIEVSQAHKTGSLPSSLISYLKLKAGMGELDGTWSSTSAIANTSDINLKNSIETLDSSYEVIFDNLKPVRFKYNSGTSNRYHTGLVAQDVQEAINKAKLTEKDFAAIVTVGDYMGIRYEELVALNIDQIQKLKKRVAELEEKVNKLEKGE